MDIVVIVGLVLLGLVWGSFANAFVWRLRSGKDWVKGRSECVHCHHKLAAKDLVPVFSWLALRGKCRYCGKPIDDSPLVELAVPLLFVLSYVFWPLHFSGQGLFVFILWLLFVLGFVILAVYDLRWFLLPDKVVFPLMWLATAQVLAVAIWFGDFWPTIIGAGLGAGLLSGLFYALWLVSKGAWIGFGDVKLAVVLGLLAGGAYQVLLLLFAASVLGMIVVLPLLATGKGSAKTQVPFGPFLLAAMIIVQLFGTPIIDWYTGLVV